MMTSFEVTPAVAEYGTEYLTVIFLGCASMLPTNFATGLLNLWWFMAGKWKKTKV
jgi:Na+-driven multidrug efflux pump